MTRCGTALRRAVVLLSLFPLVSAQIYYDNNGGSGVGRAIAGVVVAIVVVLLAAIILVMFNRRRRRLVAANTLPVVQPMSPAGERSTYIYPIRQQSYLGDNRPLPMADPSALPAYTPPPPPPPYHRKETFQGETVEIPVVQLPDTRPEPDYTAPPNTPPPAHVNPQASRFGWFNSTQ